MSAEYQKFHDDFLPRLREIDPVAAALAESAYHLVVTELPPSLETETPPLIVPGSVVGVSDIKSPEFRPTKKLTVDVAKQLSEYAGRFLENDTPLVYLLPPVGRDRFELLMKELQERSVTDHAIVRRWADCQNALLNKSQRLSLYTSMRKIVELATEHTLEKFGLRGNEVYPNVGSVRESNPRAIVEASHRYAQALRGDSTKRPFVQCHVGLPAAEFVFTALQR
ncbi:MAG: hypothetical protein M1607_02530 [Patescibacteria group bacterium]|nr:hypothetical protein [Patescibacteria group bacterium]